jgi:tellurite resistance protein TehA-like permease
MVGVGLLSFNRTYGEYPKRLVQTFGAGVASSILGIVFGTIYFLLTTYVFALIGSLLFAFGACAIAATLLLGEDIKQTDAP